MGETVWICPRCKQGSMSAGACPLCIRERKYITLVQNATGGVISLASVPADDLPRIAIPGFQSIETVMNGGFVEGSTTLCYGAAGLGKTRLALKLADRASRVTRRVLYVSSEQTIQQLKLTASVVGIVGSLILVAYQPMLDGIEHLMREQKPTFMVIDSIQNVTSGDLALVPCLERLTGLARLVGVSLLCLSHETKEGDHAGPQTVAHIVDAMIHLTRHPSLAHRLVWEVVSKYRYGTIGKAAYIHDEGGKLYDAGLRSMGREGESDPRGGIERSGSEGSAEDSQTPGSDGEAAGGPDSSHGASPSGAR